MKRCHLCHYEYEGTAEIHARMVGTKLVNVCRECEKENGRLFVGVNRGNRRKNKQEGKDNEH